MEVMVGATGEVAEATRGFLSSFDIIALDGEIAERAVSLRRTHHIKLPDAIIWATAQVHAMLLVTRNTKDFAAGDPGVRMPYRL
jgi:predicted nucleic acid-binding protein